MYKNPAKVRIISEERQKNPVKNNTYKRSEITKQKFDTGKVEVGDIFTELFSFWKYIIGVRDGRIACLEGHGDCWNVEIYENFEDFRITCSYKHTDGYWVDFFENDPELVHHHFELFKKVLNGMGVEEKRDLKINEIIFDI